MFHSVLNQLLYGVRWFLIHAETNLNEVQDLLCDFTYQEGHLINQKCQIFKSTSPGKTNSRYSRAVL